MSNMLANISSEKVVSLPNAVASNTLLLELRTLAQLISAKQQHPTDHAAVGSVIYLVELLSRVDSSQLQLSLLVSCKNNTTPENRLCKRPRVLFSSTEKD